MDALPFSFDGPTLTAAMGVIAGLGGFFSAIWSARKTARKDETDSLRATIKTLQEENERLCKRAETSEARIGKLENEKKDCNEKMSNIQYAIDFELRNKDHRIAELTTALEECQGETKTRSRTRAKTKRPSPCSQTSKDKEKEK